MRAWSSRTRGPIVRSENEKRIYLSRKPFRLVDSSYVDAISGDGTALPFKIRFRSAGRMDDRRESGLLRVKKIWRHRRRQQRRIFFDLGLPGRPVFVERVQQSFFNRR